MSSVSPSDTGAPAGIQPTCSACKRPLQLRLPPPDSMLIPVYAAVVCKLCGWIECRDCKGSPSDSPCTICGSPVMPAHTAYFADQRQP